MSNELQYGDVKYPILRESVGRIKVCGMVEDLWYKVLSVDDSFEDASENQPKPKIGESIILRYDFKPAIGGMYGYEQVFLFIFRNNNPNFVKGYSDIIALENDISKLKLELDVEYAKQQISRLRGQIKQYQKDYSL